MERIQLAEAPFTGRTMTDLYEHILAQAGIDWPGGMIFDCTKIDVSSDIQDMAYDAFMRATGAPEWACNMYWAMSGPKVEKDLPPHTVVLQDGYLVHDKANQENSQEQPQDDESHDL